MYCQDENVCLNGDQCLDDSTGRYCVPANSNFSCQCRVHDGFFMNSTTCEDQRENSLVIEITVLDETYRLVYTNPWASAFRAKMTTFERLVLMRLREDPSTSDVLSVNGFRIQNGSLVVSMVLLYPDSPPQSDVRRVLTTDQLTDGTVTVRLSPSAIEVSSISTTQNCPPDYCGIGATSCIRSGYYPGMFNYTCSCGTSFTGERCDQVISLPTDVPSETTETATKPPATDNLSTLEIILIIVACIFLLLAVGGLLLCFCLVTRHRYEAGRHYSTQSWRKSGIPRINYGLSEYNDDIYYHDGGYEMSNFGDEEIRMKRLKNVMSHSPYLQQGLQGRHDFVRPFVVTGDEDYYYDNQRDEESMVGHIVYNPIVHR
ncbi:uncharacterized protein LOC110990604 [Acanthaster planci]|uniref:Uncharacterized protein LOC110990604 n=1 Tax=Acanthaster planci TaxID=133434 RepID=A0A8B8A5X9_ACAPL|nr:uncharacterized protein LOC110990604 [Acanthaster planci]